MHKLVSKVQYNGFEPGEFTEIQARTLEETSELISQFLWSKYRGASVELTCPSITIESHDGSAFLKLGMYYNMKYCFYLYEGGKLYHKVVEQLSEAIPWVSQFFEDVNLSTQFKKDPFQFPVRKHFITKDFTYRVTLKRCMWFLLYPLLFTIFYFGMFVTISTQGHELLPYVLSTLFLFFMWFVGAGINFIFFINYYLHSKDLFIRISRGLDHFEFGTKDNYHTYSKNEIRRVKEWGFHSASKIPWSGNSIFEVCFKDNTVIRFPNLLIGGSLLDKIGWEKLSFCERKFPFIKGKEFVKKLGK